MEKELPNTVSSLEDKSLCMLFMEIPLRPAEQQVCSNGACAGACSTSELTKMCSALQK